VRKAIRIGRLFGIELAVDTSWIFIFALVVWSLTSVFQVWHPMWTTGSVFTVALVTGFAFFGSILLHELAHALVAKRVVLGELEGRLRVEIVERPAGLRVGTDLLALELGQVAVVLRSAAHTHPP
jgi:Zn-dependent protease